MVPRLTEQRLGSFYQGYVCGMTLNLICCIQGIHCWSGCSSSPVRESYILPAKSNWLMAQHWTPWPQWYSKHIHFGVLALGALDHVEPYVPCSLCGASSQSLPSLLQSPRRISPPLCLGGLSHSPLLPSHRICHSSRISPSCPLSLALSLGLPMPFSH